MRRPRRDTHFLLLPAAVTAEQSTFVSAKKGVLTDGQRLTSTGRSLFHSKCIKKRLFDLMAEGMQMCFVLARMRILDTTLYPEYTVEFADNCSDRF